MEHCLAEGFPIDDYFMYDGDGEFIAHMKLLRIAGPDLPAVNGMPRPALHQILTDAATRGGARIRLGMTVEVLDDGPDGVTVTLNDGTREVYDLVVGADGIKSRIRTLLFGCQFDPQYTGHAVWRFTTERMPEVDHQIMYFGVGVKAGIMPVSREQMYLLLVTNEPDNPDRRRINSCRCCATVCNRSRRLSSGDYGIRSRIRRTSSTARSRK